VEFAFHPQLAQQIAKFERGEASAEDVCWAFTASRVEHHSSTFSWDTAQLDRLLPLVCKCCTSPPLDTAEPQRVAEVLVKQRETAWDERRAMIEPIRSSLAEAQRALSSSLMRDLVERQREQTRAWQEELGARTFQSILEQQRRQIEQLGRISAVPRLRQVLKQQRQQAEAWRRSLQPSLEVLRQSLDATARPPAVTEAIVQEDIEPVVERTLGAASNPTSDAVIPLILELRDRIAELSDQVIRLEAASEERADKIEADAEERAEAERGRYILSIYIQLLLFLVQLIISWPSPPPSPPPDR
jgi:hypothetical protein